jgi:hypothetical protein
MLSLVLSPIIKMLLSNIILIQNRVHVSIKIVLTSSLKKLHISICFALMTLLIEIVYSDDSPKL